MWNWSSNIDAFRFPAHWHSSVVWSREPFWDWVHIASDLTIFAALVAAGASLLRKRSNLPWPRMWLLFAVFLLMFGFAHFVDAALLWWPVHRLGGILKFLTAMTSWAAVLTLIALLPSITADRVPAESQNEAERSLKEMRGVNRRIRENAEILRQSLNAARLGTWNWILPTRQAWLDHAAMQLTGMGTKAGAILVDQFLERVHRDDKEGLDRALQQTFETHQPYNHTFRLYVPEKGYRWLQSRGAVFVNAQGVAERLVGVLFDITEEMSEQEAMRVGTRAIEFATNGIIITDARMIEQPIVYVNPAFERLTGYSSSEVVGRNCRFLQGKGTDPATVQQLRDAIQRRQKCEVTILNYRQDGTPFWNSLQISPVENDEGVVVHYVGVQSDVTQSVENEKRLREAQQAAETASLAKSEFLANMSHEIRTPLTAILGCADSLCRDLAGAEPLATARTIRSQGQLLTGILNDILDLSKIEAGKLEIHREPCSVLGILSDVCSLMEAQAHDKGLELLTYFDSMLPENIYTDQLRFRQILLNLTSNAIKFTHRGRVEIHARCDREGLMHNLTISVRDTGIGIPADRLDAIFEAFTQVDGPIARRAGGTGLGLTICQRLARMLDGELTVVSEVHRGSTFTITLPVGTQELLSLDELNKRRQLKESHEAMDVVIPARILIAEDTLAIQYMLQRILTPIVDEVMVVNNGAEAVDAIVKSHKTSPFQLVLMDMQMPIMNGYDATERLRSLGYDLPVVALTAGAMAGDRERCLAVGCTDYLSKPVGRAQLISTIQTYCSRPVPERVPSK